MLETLVDEFRLLPAYLGTDLSVSRYRNHLLAAYLAEIELDGLTGRSMAGAPVNDILDYGGHDEGADSSCKLLN
jgi:hypothetical protein